MSSHQPPIPAEMLDEAIRLAVRLESGRATPADHAACRQWREADPQHEAAWQQLQALQNEFGQLQQSTPRLMYQVLAKREPLRNGRRQAVKLLGLALAGAGGTWWAWRQPQWVQETGYHTATGERRHITLADGSQLWLNTGSRLTLQLTPFSRTLTLHGGEIQLQTGADSDNLLGSRPLRIITPHAELIPVGTRFAVRLYPDSTTLAVSQGRVIIRRRGQQDVLADTGGYYRISHHAASPVMPVIQAASTPDGWVQGVLEVRNMPLAEFMTELARYSHDALLCDPAVADLRLSGVFQLKGRDPVPGVLAALALSLPVNIHRQSHGWVVQARRHKG